MTFHFDTQFLRDYEMIPRATQKKLRKQMDLLAAQGVTYPGLGARKMQGQAHIWEARVDVHYRFTFQMHGDIVLLRRVGTHEIYRNP